MMRLHSIFFALLIVGLLSGCAGLGEGRLATPIPDEMLPTVIALTLDASGVYIATQAHITTDTVLATAKRATPVPTETSTPELTATDNISITAESPAITQAPSPSAQVAVEVSPSATLPNNILQSTPSSTPAPALPEARVQIYRLGELSLVTSPIEVSVRLTSRTGKVVRVDLHGEDGRLLARQVRIYNTVPWQVARLAEELNFEISAAAENGRLVISVEDSFGRLVDVNSVNLILLSQGVTDLNSASALHQRIDIQEPQYRALIQGGTLIASGRALLYNGEQPLKAMLVGEDGHILGQRLASVKTLIPGDYGTFVVEIPYTISEITPALLTIFEGGGQMSDIIYLSSLEVILAP